ncbi:MAG: hypothetical protein IJ379_10580 [Lachnospiraceae bacterium]|nr:hypothetical protein [Lachnospiraceae bacterium]
MDLKKKLYIIGFGIVLLVGLVGVVGIVGIQQYLDEVPVLTAKENVNATTDMDLHYKDIAVIEKSRDTEISSFSWEDGREQTEAYISKDKATIHFGKDTGTCMVTISAVGNNSEHRDITIPVMVEENQ